MLVFTCAQTEQSRIWNYFEKLQKVHADSLWAQWLITSHWYDEGHTTTIITTTTPTTTRHTTITITITITITVTVTITFTITMTILSLLRLQTQLRSAYLVPACTQ